MATVISLLNMKGGVGKTTLAVNLAWHAFRRGKKRVLLVDLDPQFNASQYMMDFEAYEEHVKDYGTVADILIDSPTLGMKKKVKKKAAKKRIARLEDSPAGHYLDFLPSQLELAHVVKNPAQMEYRLQKALDPLRKDYDYIFIDCAPTDSILTTMALTASEYLLIPVRPDRFSILGYANLLRTVEEFKEHSVDPNEVQDLGVIFTQVRGKSPIEGESMEAIRDYANTEDRYVFDAELIFSDTFIRAIEDQTPAFETKYARTDLKESISAIANEMQSRIDEISEPEGQ